MIDLIQAATLSNNPQLQKNAENSILKLRIEQPAQFFLQTATILQSLDLATNIRQAAGTLLTVSLKFKANDQYLWQALSLSEKASFKEMVLGTMIDKEKSIRRAAANIVAAICCIEIPRKEWPGIAEKITANMSNEDLVVKEVSILTIGFICEQLREFNFTFEDQIQQTILTAILLGVKDAIPEIAETAFKALRDGIAALSGILKNPQYCDYLIKQIIGAINSKTLVQLALQSLIQFLRSSFALMAQNYVEWFATVIDPIICNTAEDVPCTLAMQFWATFAKEEKSIQSNPSMTKYIKGPLAQRLVTVLLNNLCFIEQDEDQGNGISESAASALEAIFQGDSVEHENRVLIFTQEKISHQNWRFRQASIRAFALLLIGLPETRSQQLVNASLLSLVALLNDKQQYVQLSAMNSLCLITQQTGQVILHHANFLEILKLIVGKIHVNEHFLKSICKIIDNLCVASEQSESKTLAIVSDDLIELLLKVCVQPSTSNNAINNCLTTILSLIKNSQSAAVSQKYIGYVLTNFPHLKGLERQKRETFYSGFFTMAQVCLMTIRKVNDTITMDQLSTLYNLVVDYYKALQDVQGDGYYVVSALAFFLPNDLRLVSDFWKYIQYGLKKINQEDIFRATISCICDFASIYRTQIADRLDFIFNELLDIFEKNLITRELKLEVLMCFGELFLQCGSTSLKHLKRVADLLLISCEGVIHLNDQNYAQVLQETVIQTFMCIYHGLNSNGRSPQLVQYIKYVFEFVNLTTDKARRPKLDYVKDAMVLLGDIVSFYPAQSRVYMSAPFISERISTLQKYNKNGLITQSISYIRGQFHL